MKKTMLILGLIAIFTTVSVAQTKDSIQLLNSRIGNLENRNSNLSKQVNIANSNIKKLEGRVASAADSVEALKQQLVLTNANLQEMSKKLEMQIKDLSNKSNSDFAVLSKSMRHTTLYWIISIIAIVLFATILFAWLRLKLSFIKSDLSDQIKTSSETIRDEIKKLDNQLFWSLDFQKNISKPDHDESGEANHSLALKVADEIVRIQKNISSMDPETKGLKQLEFAVERIQDNFRENGYEMVELLNKYYDPGMKAAAKFKPDQNLKQGQQVITRIIKPLIKYNNIIIQEAQVEVSVGEDSV